MKNKTIKLAATIGIASFMMTTIAANADTCSPVTATSVAANGTTGEEVHFRNDGGAYCEQSGAIDLFLTLDDTVGKSQMALLLTGISLGRAFWIAYTPGNPGTLDNISMASGQ